MESSKERHPEHHAGRVSNAVLRCGNRFGLEVSNGQASADKGLARGKPVEALMEPLRRDSEAIEGCQFAGKLRLMKQKVGRCWENGAVVQHGELVGQRCADQRLPASVFMRMRDKDTAYDGQGNWRACRATVPEYYELGGIVQAVTPPKYLSPRPRVASSCQSVR